MITCPSCLTRRLTTGNPLPSFPPQVALSPTYHSLHDIRRTRQLAPSGRPRRPVLPSPLPGSSTASHRAEPRPVHGHPPPAPSRTVGRPVAAAGVGRPTRAAVTGATGQGPPRSRRCCDPRRSPRPDRPRLRRPSGLPASRGRRRRVSPTVQVHAIDHHSGREMDRHDVRARRGRVRHPWPHRGQPAAARRRDRDRRCRRWSAIRRSMGRTGTRDRSFRAVPPVELHVTGSRSESDRRRRRRRSARHLPADRRRCGRRGRALAPSGNSRGRHGGGTGPLPSPPVPTTTYRPNEGCLEGIASMRRRDLRRRLRNVPPRFHSEVPKDQRPSYSPRM